MLCIYIYIYGCDKDVDIDDFRPPAQRDRGAGVPSGLPGQGQGHQGFAKKHVQMKLTTRAF